MQVMMPCSECVATVQLHQQQHFKNDRWNTRHMPTSMLPKLSNHSVQDRYFSSCIGIAPNAVSVSKSSQAATEPGGIDSAQQPEWQTSKQSHEPHVMHYRTAPGQFHMCSQLLHVKAVKYPVQLSREVDAAQRLDLCSMASTSPSMLPPSCMPQGTAAAGKPYSDVNDRQCSFSSKGT
jgi:hypothetical protein